jgi:oligoribonuclease NrnB/cAMP/cGMP phosphodiesterase (DHH superfamily)
MSHKTRLSELEQDIDTWNILIENGTKLFEKLLKASQTASNPDERRRLDDLVSDYDKALKKLGKHKIHAETRLIRAQNGYPE